MPDDKLRPPIYDRADPANWGESLRGKLCYLHGFVMGRTEGYNDNILLHECTDEQIVDSIIRMLLRQNVGEQRAKKRRWWA